MQKADLDMTRLGRKALYYSRDELLMSNLSYTLQECVHTQTVFTIDYSVCFFFPLLLSGHLKAICCGYLLELPL